MTESSNHSAIRNIVVFASGNGSNAENIAGYFNNGPGAGCGLTVTAIVTNRSDAGVVAKAKSMGIPVRVVDRSMLADSSLISGILDDLQADIIILAGFLLLIPGFIIHRYAGRILNIHPSLLPRHGGPGMYGRHVHDAVIASGDNETGITIHRVTEEYDRGEIVFQARIPVEPTDTAADIEAKVRRLEMLHYPSVIRHTFTNPSPDSCE